MSDLYDQIDKAEKFTGPKTDAPVIDHSGQIAFGLDWAKRQTAAPPAAEIKQMAPIVPVAN